MSKTAAPADTATAPTAGGQANPFWEVTNLFAQKNRDGVTTATLGAAAQDISGNINAGNFLRGLRVLMRSANGALGGGTLNPDAPFNVIKRAGVENTDGAEIIYNAIGGYAHAQKQRYGRPWLQDPSTAYDYSASANPSCTLFLQPEVRQQLGVLENTDTRSQYRFSLTLAALADVISGGTPTAPAVTITPYADMWAQPDDKDLEAVPNQRIPPGANLQTKTRHQTFTLNGAGADNNFLSELTGNAVRLMLLIVRDSTLARQDYLSDPIQWQLDSRNLGALSPDVVFQWANDFYAAFGGRARPTGVYPFPRFYNPGALYGQGWLYTANSTSLSWESSTLSTASNVPGTVELLQEEVYAVGPVDPALIDL